MKKFCFIFLLSIVAAVNAQNELKTYEPSAPERIAGQPYEKYTTVDRFKRTISFYLTKAESAKGPLPVVLFIEGSGCGSRFMENGGRIYPAGGHIVAADVFRSRARVLVVEKPAVKYLSQQQDCSKETEFNRELTLERWAEANEAALNAVRKLPNIELKNTLVAGHSEGGLVACRIARDLPGIVTHVSAIAGGGVSQLFDIISLTRQGEFFSDVSPVPETRVQFVLDKWKEIEADPMSTEKFFFGFAFRRWSTFLASSPVEELTSVPAKIYIAQGTADRAVDPASADALFAHLKAKNKQVIYDRVEGADHSFRIKDKPNTDGWQELFERLSKWFLQA